MNEEERDVVGRMRREIFIFPRYGETLNSKSGSKAGDGVNSEACFIWICEVWEGSWGDFACFSIDVVG